MRPGGLLPDLNSPAFSALGSQEADGKGLTTWAYEMSCIQNNANLKACDILTHF
jgi:hypothetical protein